MMLKKHETMTNPRMSRLPVLLPRNDLNGFSTKNLLLQVSLS